MKNVLKLIISLLVCCLMLLSACGTPSTPSLPSELKAPNTDYPSTISIIAPDFFKYKYTDNADQIKLQWLDEMSQRYGVKFNIISDYYTNSGDYDNSASNKIIDIAMGDTSLNGMFLISSANSLNLGLKTCLEYGSIMPLEDYLEDNPVWNALPDDIKSLFEVDGHIYAIPTSVSRTQMCRIIHNEAYENIGITITDLDSFRDFAVAYAQKTGNAAIGCIDVEEATDILNAFGLYPGDSTSNPFGYDPIEDCCVDWMSKGAAVDALEYLRELYKAGAINLSSSQDSKKFESGVIASAINQYFDFDEYTEVLTLNPEYPQIADTTKSGFAMTKDTPQPKETINLLVNMLFGSEQNYLECWLGSSDNYTLNSDGTITVEMAQDSEGNYKYPGMPNLTGGLPDIFPYSDASIFYSQNGKISMESEVVAGKKNACLKLLDDSIKNGSVVVLPSLCQNIRSATYDANIKDVGKLYMDCFQKAIISKDKTVQQIIDEYKEAMFNMGGNAMLDEINAAIGKQTAYYYG